VELEHGQTRAVITNTLLSALELLEQETGRLPIVYSRALWVDANLRVADLPRVDWWLAQYYYRRPFPQYTPEYPCPPRLPKGVDQWLIHQTSERGPAIGGAGNYMDYDRWNGTEADVLAYFGRAALVNCPLDGAICPVRSACSAEAAQCEAVAA
jgi:GH25 family lysozyme M1 (1,4-beta-N-acetylmuramidase)